jgi:UPF0271 protein
MNRLNINCDVGEGVNNEMTLMPYIQSCNIACGGHAGNKKLMEKVVKLALKHEVNIGAHPSYPDIENFGRKTMIIDPSELAKTIQKQINLLNKIVIEQGGSLSHIKPHGALYNDVSKKKDLALHFLNAILPYKNSLKLFVPFNSEIEICALENGFSIVYEAFADRNYNDDLSLVARNEKEAVITDVEIIEVRILEMINTERVTTISGKKVFIKASTFCVHSDTENAIEIVRKLHQE